MTLIALTGWGQDADASARRGRLRCHLVKPLEISELSVYLELSCRDGHSGREVIGRTPRVAPRLRGRFTAFA